MLQFDELSYWEKTVLTEDIDFLVVGGGIVGIATALRLRELHSSAKIILLERGYISTGASTKNAGFACFGSLTELADDLESMPADAVWSTVEMRWKGLQRLRERFSDEQLGLKINGSWDLIANHEKQQIPKLSDHIESFNQNIKNITGLSDCFSYDSNLSNKAGFSGIDGGFYNRLEGELDTGKLFIASNFLLAQAQIHCLYGIEVTAIHPSENEVLIETTFGTLKTRKLAITVNGFAQQLLTDNRIQPARAQVVVTSKISGFNLPGTFHYQKGYYYFRSINERLLLGGGRNLNFHGETTTEIDNTEEILSALKNLIDSTIIPYKKVSIDYRWAGIMGVGNEKKPIIELIHPHVGMGVRMGGMGVAIGSLVGEELASLLH